MEFQATEVALHVLKDAVDEVATRGHDSVRAEHIVLGLLNRRSGVASDVLDRVGVDRKSVRTTIDGMIPPQRERAPKGEYPYHPTGTKIIEQAWDKLTKDGQERLTSGHLLQVLLQVEGPGRDAFQSSDASLASLNDALRGVDVSAE